MLKGVPVPMVLRKAQGESYYQVVGQAYFYGFMDGEALDSDDIREQIVFLA